MRFSTRDVSRVEPTWHQYVPSASLHKADPARFRFDWYSAELGDVSLVRYRIAAAVQSMVEPQEQFLACRVDGPVVQLRSGRREIAASRPWISDGPSVNARWDEGAVVSALIFSQPSLERFARQSTGDDTLSLHVTDAAATSSQAGALWEQTVDYLERSIDALGPDDEILRAELARHASIVTLSTFATTMHGRRTRTPQTGPAPLTVRRALDFIAENAHRPITVDHVAEAVHISTRGLQYAFRRSLDLSPAECLRQARLDGAHRELRSGTASTVAAVARRWGFSHPSRFAAAYREAFGVSPSMTIGAHRR